MSVAIVDYGSGNLHSAAKAFERAAYEAGLDQSITVTRDPQVVAPVRVRARRPSADPRDDAALVDPEVLLGLALLQGEDRQLARLRDERMLAAAA